ncbi:hypothetical protein HanHA300_Chr11g0394961 [Helianthus annuus]|nr:hypothetical protein HanHA300_Chr11g0394961 [Helianthus annuus]KAJ0516827.1 hypothetical protein HanHA89_Chr11g0418161 [Helianthus annuus]KAJ0684832.1 hypothetical protein HanLR1_Chr11g0395591 [Helianthus annuus]
MIDATTKLAGEENLSKYSMSTWISLVSINTGIENTGTVRFIIGT